MSKKKALRVIESLEGTLVNDLRSLKIIAEERSLSDELRVKLPGAFNYLLFTAGLIACETIGYFIKKDSEEGRTYENINHFISSNYFKGNALKKKKYLNKPTPIRHNLSHVFGMTNMAMESISENIILCVGGSNKHEIICEGNDVKINGVKFVEQVIEGFELIKYEIQSGEDSSTLIGIISGSK